MTRPLVAVLSMLVAVLPGSRAVALDTVMPNRWPVAGSADSIVRQFAVPIPMRDGMTLFADVYRPAVAHPVPVVLERTVPVVAQQAVHRGGVHASFVSLPVVPDPRVVPKP